MSVDHMLTRKAWVGAHEMATNAGVLDAARNMSKQHGGDLEKLQASLAQSPDNGRPR